YTSEKFGPTGYFFWDRFTRPLVARQFSIINHVHTSIFPNHISIFPSFNAHIAILHSNTS
ncbi:MAG TPA: hypothetical protein PL069_08160, partial [Saprospiraceae bacterium]|nr:hypothetical protein [Saprospiraceae bacterium]